MKKIVLILLLAAMAFPLKIISAAPSITETIFAINAQSSLIAVSKYCNFPQAATQLPNIGGHYDFNRESIILKNPDLVMLLKGNTSLMKFLNKQKIDYIAYDNESIHGLLQMIEQIGEQTNQSVNAMNLVKKLRKDLREYCNMFKESNSIKVLLIVEQVIKSNQLNAAYILGQEDFYTPILSALKMENIYKGKMKYPLISTEALIHYDPEIIIVLGKETREAYQGLPLKAIRNNKLYFFGDDVFKRPGPRFTQIIQTFSKIRSR